MEKNTLEKKEIKPIKLGTKMVMKFIDLTHEGLGVAKISGDSEDGTHYENFPIFVMGALPFEQGIVEINRLTKSYGYKVDALIFFSPLFRASIYLQKPSISCFLNALLYFIIARDGTAS